MRRKHTTEDSEQIRAIGQKINGARYLNGMSCQELADRIGCSRELVQKWEHGERRIHADDLKKLCEALDVSADYILGIDNTSYLPETLQEHIIFLAQNIISIIKEVEHHAKQ